MIKLISDLEETYPADHSDTDYGRADEEPNAHIRHGDTPFRRVVVPSPNE